jgi:hypothetical protein
MRVILTAAIAKVTCNRHERDHDEGQCPITYEMKKVLLVFRDPKSRRGIRWSDVSYNHSYT